MKDLIDKNELAVEYCPTYHMLADYFTKPLQGRMFKAYRDVLMGWKHISSLKELTVSNMKERVENSIQTQSDVKETLLACELQDTSSLLILQLTKRKSR